MTNNKQEEWNEDLFIGSKEYIKKLQEELAQAKEEIKDKLKLVVRTYNKSGEVINKEMIMNIQVPENATIIDSGDTIQILGIYGLSYSNKHIIKNEKERIKEGLRPK